MIDLNNIKLNDWGKTRISILGAGKSGMATADLATHIGADVFVSDKGDSPKLRQKLGRFEFETGGHTQKVLNCDLVIISPGISDKIDIVQDCLKNAIPIVSEIEFGSWFTDSPILALTGSNGKTTTVNLLHQICLSAGYDSLMGGNVGIPFSENVLLECKTEFNNPVHVLELSSFQLEHISHFSPHIGAILNISEDHMNRYEDINHYASAKLNIAKNIKEPGWLVFNADDTLLPSLLKGNLRTRLFSLHPGCQAHFKLNATKVYSGTSDRPEILFNLEDTKLKGAHNLQNILAAATMSDLFGIPAESIARAIHNFSPIPHRLEWIGNLRDVDFYNDSKATNIASAKAAIESFENNIILILGGQNKGKTDFRQLNESMKMRVKEIITYGQAGKEIETQLKSDFITSYFHDFKSAVIQANVSSHAGDTVLLSPACASFDQFENYEARGNAIRAIFQDLELAE